MKPEAAYRIYLGLRLHFTQPKYMVHLVKNLPPLPKNKSIPFAIQKKSKDYTSQEWIEYLIANFVDGDRYGGAFTDGERVYLEWKKRKEGLLYFLKEDLTNLKDIYRLQSIEEVWNSPSYPPILQAWLGKKINLETVVVINRLYKYKGVLDKRWKDDILWEPLSMIMAKYQPFVSVDMSQVEQIVQQAFPPE